VALIELKGDNTARGRSRARRARAVFHGALAHDLNDRGAATIDELWLRLDWFLLPLDREEIEEIVESARRHGIVTEAFGRRDPSGERVRGEWTCTKAGRKLGRPTALSFPDLGHRLVGKNDSLAKLIDSVKSAAAALLPLAAVLLGIHVLDAPTTGTLATAAVVGAVIVSVFAYGINGELNLRCAAAAWPRFQSQRSARWRYQRSWVCALYLPLAVAAVSVTVGVCFRSGHLEPPPAQILVAEGLLLIGTYFAVVLPLHRGWAPDRAKCGEEWRARAGSNVAEAA
jgi:hypothetical protein